MIEIEKSAEDKKEQQPRSVTFVDILAWAYIVIISLNVGLEGYRIIKIVTTFGFDSVQTGALVSVGLGALLIVLILGTFGKTAKMVGMVLATVGLIVWAFLAVMVTTQLKKLSEEMFATTPAVQAVVDKCLSGDGHSERLQELVKRELDEPGSFKALATSYDRDNLFNLLSGDLENEFGNRYLYVSMTYRVGEKYKIATGYLDKTNCQVARYRVDVRNQSPCRGQC